MDFLGYVRVRVDRSKPLSENPEVYLDSETPAGADCDPDGTIGYLRLSGDSFCFEAVLPISATVIPVSECIVNG